MPAHPKGSPNGCVDTQSGTCRSCLADFDSELQRCGSSQLRLPLAECPIEFASRPASRLGVTALKRNWCHVLAKPMVVEDLDEPFIMVEIRLLYWQESVPRL